MALTSGTTRRRRPNDSELAAEARRVAEEPGYLQEVQEIMRWMDDLRPSNDCVNDESAAAHEQGGPG
jgi:hypothetical protein